MNILFLCRSYTIGGVNVVTQYLSERFFCDGNQVGIFTLNPEPRGMEMRYLDKVKLFEGVGKWLNWKTLMKMRHVLREENVDVIINNWGFRPVPVIMFKLVQLGLKNKAKIVSIYHNDPTTNGLLQRISIAKEQAGSGIKRFLFNSISKIVVKFSAFKFRIGYNISDRFVLLSRSFVTPFINFSGIKESNKIKVISNPITIDNSDFVYNKYKKQKEIIYVGRLDERQKRVSRIIDIWKKLECKHNDWKLTIVGDGAFRDALEQQVALSLLKNVSFEGYQDPREYYERASILLLTSEFEGFGLVIVEGMQFGVVPVVYGSYQAVYDIIENEKDGIIIPYKQDGFDVNAAAAIIENIMSDDEYLSRLAMTAQKSSNAYSLDVISKQWYSLFDEIRK